MGLSRVLVVVAHHPKIVQHHVRLLEGVTLETVLLVADHHNRVDGLVGVDLGFKSTQLIHCNNSIT